MSSKPLVSVGMPVRNSEPTIGLAIASIVAQTYPDWELIVLDDGSDDSTVATARSYGDRRIRVISDGRRKGIPVRRNEIISLSRGKYLAWMDSDDISYPRRLAIEVDYLESRPQVDLVASEMTVFRNTREVVGKRSIPADHALICRRPYWGFPMSQPTFMGRMSWFLEHRYDERMKRAEDQDILLRAFRRSTFAGIQQILVGYRETNIDLKKIVVGRRLWAASVWRDAKRNSSLTKGIEATIIQIGKIVLEGLAVVSGLNYVVLRHRAKPVSEGERREFEMVFTSVRDLAGTAGGKETHAAWKR